MPEGRRPFCNQSDPPYPRRSGRPSSCGETGACRDDARSGADRPEACLMGRLRQAAVLPDSGVQDFLLPFDILPILSVRRGGLFGATRGDRCSFLWAARGAAFAAAAQLLLALHFLVEANRQILNHGVGNTQPALEFLEE